MNVLIIGAGAREHTLAWKFSQSPRVSALFIAGGNAGTEEIGTNVSHIDENDYDGLVQFCRSHEIDLVFIGPEKPLSLGIVDRFSEAGISVIGPNQHTSQLESSKVFSKDFMARHKLPCAASLNIASPAEFEQELSKLKGKIVIKKNGLAAGKGVLESADPNEIRTFGLEILKTDSLLIEEFLEGYELSVFALCDGKDYLLLPAAADFKKSGENDSGLNTGGMGAICPVPGVDEKLWNQIKKEVIEPVFQGLREENLMYKGVLYFGLMMTAKGPKILEFNTRFGDPEAQVVLPLIESDFLELCLAMVAGNLAEFPLTINKSTAVGIIVASAGYPGPNKAGIPVAPIPTFPEKDALIFHANTSRNKAGQMVTGGGRCFTAVGLHRDIVSATKRAYEIVTSIKFAGSWYRKDIAKKFFQD